MLDYYTMFGLIDDAPQLPVPMEPDELKQVGGGGDHPNCYSGHAGGQKVDNNG